jgi:hypothetical protein
MQCAGETCRLCPKRYSLNFDLLLSKIELRLMILEKCLLSGILVAIVAWLIINVVMYLLCCGRITSDLVTDLSREPNKVANKFKY